MLIHTPPFAIPASSCGRLANESNWSGLFERSNSLVQAIDPTAGPCRPFFEYGLPQSLNPREHSAHPPEDPCKHPIIIHHAPSSRICPTNGSAEANGPPPADPVFPFLPFVFFFLPSAIANAFFLRWYHERTDVDIDPGLR